MCVLPGLVDGHTHPVFAGDRVHEFAMKVQAREENCTSVISVTLIIHEESELSTCNKMSVPRFHIHFPRITFVAPPRHVIHILGLPCTVFLVRLILIYFSLPLIKAFFHVFCSFWPKYFLWWSGLFCLHKLDPRVSFLVSSSFWPHAWLLSFRAKSIDLSTSAETQPSCQCPSLERERQC